MGSALQLIIFAPLRRNTQLDKIHVICKILFMHYVGHIARELFNRVTRVAIGRHSREGLMG